MKTQIKIYDKLWNFKDNIELKNLIWEITFSEDMNWWQWSLSLNLALWYYSDIILQSDILQVREFSDVYPNWNAIYTWIVEDVKIVEDTNWKQITIKVLGLYSLLNDFLYKDSGNLTFTKNEALEVTLKDIIDDFNAEYGVLNTINWPSNINSDKIIRYTVDSIDISWITINQEFDKNNLLKSIGLLQKNIEYYFYIDETWLFHFKANRTEANKKLTFEKNIISINQTDTKNTLVNRLHLERDWWIIKIYNDIASQTLYWIKEKYESKTDLLDEASQDIYWTTYINDNKDVKQKSVIITNINTEIHPWDNIKTLNTENQIESLQVVKINITSSKRTVYLDEYVWLWRLILNN